MVFLGTISYAIYLWHVLVINESAILAYRLHLAPSVPDFNFFVITGLTLVITIVLAMASWYLIERPAIRLSRGDLGHWWSTRVQRPTTTTPEPEPEPEPEQEPESGTGIDATIPVPLLPLGLTERESTPWPTAQPLLE